MPVSADGASARASDSEARPSPGRRRNRDLRVGLAAAAQRRSGSAPPIRNPAPPSALVTLSVLAAQLPDRLGDLQQILHASPSTPAPGAGRRAAGP
jgi:hypothetical protein